MIIKCIQNNHSQIELPENLLSYLNTIHPSGVDRPLPLLTNKIYICYAIVFGPYTNWFFIMDETGIIYPQSYPDILFSYIDKSVSKYWKTGTHINFENQKFPMLAFEEWSDNDFFHGQLFEGDTNAINIFKEYKK